MRDTRSSAIGWVARGAAVAALVVGLGMGSAEAAPFVYVTNRVSASVSHFDVLAGGTLALLSPAVVAAAGPVAMATSPDGTSLYVVNEDSLDVSQ